ncbi:MAG TPA: 3-hydroxybutyryl-CoA dehydrogenase [Pusillimonas sp.]|uniref:3-hydroxybutyryl-CoA dehydrogenase n=1 Tax=Pusillimonas sp. TaxID=3040095 RepID=UPI002CDE332A|nr:3-hydroxybutyryl-CoA dehydrogenase [Pusillimonas sp.]HUH88347.1 3-hydroxybutyryl-CoA dehydrogenase [Pusillimonas sp.]
MSRHTGAGAGGQAARHDTAAVSHAATQPRTPAIVALGAGRMGRGIALAYAMHGHPVAIVDFKPRAPKAFKELQTSVANELRLTYQQLADLGLFAADKIEGYLQNIELHSLDQAAAVLGSAQIIFEGVPETPEAKRDALGRLGELASPNALIASTTSTMLASDLAPLVRNPQRFMNAHWLNPAYIIPLVEVSPHPGTEPQAVDRLLQSLESIGKVPVRCACTPGYIVPRLQTLVMNEAARMVEEGVATAEEIDRATRYGLGFRFAAIGVLEFIDYGGNDILYHANNYLAKNLDANRFAMPEIVRQYMNEGKNGLRSASGFRSYEGLDLEAYRRDVLARTLGMLRHFGLDQHAISNDEKGTRQ